MSTASFCSSLRIGWVPGLTRQADRNGSLRPMHRARCRQSSCGNGASPTPRAPGSLPLVFLPARARAPPLSRPSPLRRRAWRRGGSILRPRGAALSARACGAVRDAVSCAPR